MKYHKDDPAPEVPNQAQGKQENIHYVRGLP